MTLYTRPDPMGSVTSLTRAERAEARQRFQDDPEALWPAIRAALGLEHAETVLDDMQALLREVRSCEP